MKLRSEEIRRGPKKGWEQCEVFLSCASLYLLSVASHAWGAMAFVAGLSRASHRGSRIFRKASASEGEGS